MAHNRKHIRLRDYDYSWENAYFITICTKERKNFFCNNAPAFVTKWTPNNMLSPIGEVATSLLLNIPKHFAHAIIDAFIIMPNHIHFILILDYSNIPQAGILQKEGVEQYLPNSNQFSKPVKGSISVIIAQYKAEVTKWCNSNGHTYFAWQKRFHDHVIRDYKSHEAIHHYIYNNPQSWNLDELYIESPGVIPEDR